MKTKPLLPWILALVYIVALVVVRAGDGEFNLADFGPVGTPVDAEATLKKATSDIIAKGGGILVVAPGVAADWVAHNDAPSSTKAGTPSVTIIDRRNGYEKVMVPGNGQLVGSTWAGRHLVREVRQPIDMELGVHSTETIDTYIAGGTTSYDQQSQNEVKAGTNARIYLPTIRGLAVGNRMVITGVPMSYGEPYDRGPIKALGWDKEKGQAYIEMDLKHDHPRNALVYDKHVVNSMTISDHSQSDNQSMGLMVKRLNYAQGDSFVISASACSMGNVMSAAGDEGGLTYASDIYNDLQPFRSKVEKVDWAKCELVYEAGNVRNHTLGTSRPIINMNGKKHIAAGTVMIVAPGNQDPWDASDKRKTGKMFEKQVFPGGAIIGSKDCGWTKEVVGRFFAVDEPGEYLDPKSDGAAGYTGGPDLRAYRWYQIQKYEDRSDGTKRIYIERTRWWSRNDVAPNLYDAENYTWDGHVKTLHYIIAPGAYVADVSRAWTACENTGGWIPTSTPRTLVLAPSSDAGTRHDFEKGDPIVQAIGADPWNVSGMRVRHFNYLPTTIEDGSFQSVNWGRVAVDTALSVTGGSMGDLAQDEKDSKDKQPKFRKGIDLAATTYTGIRFGGDVKYAAIVFEQPHGRAQPIAWNVKDKPASTLTVDPKTGEFALQGGATRMSGMMVEGTGGISGGDKPAHNLRGIAVPVKKDANELEVTFLQPEADAVYAVQVQPNWLTALAVSKKTAKGFVIRFDKAAPDVATVDWILIR